jgi:hypothetical protein
MFSDSGSPGDMPHLEYFEVGQGSSAASSAFDALIALPAPQGTDSAISDFESQKGERYERW